MATKKTIAIIGATSRIGAAISKMLAKSNYRLLLMSDKTDQLDIIVEQIKRQDVNLEIEKIGCSTEACWEADVIILAEPNISTTEIVEKIKPVATGKVVISLVNFSNDGVGNLSPKNIDPVPDMKDLLPHSKFIDVFNLTDSLGSAAPAIDEEMLEALIADNELSIIKN